MDISVKPIGGSYLVCAGESRCCVYVLGSDWRVTSAYDHNENPKRLMDYDAHEETFCQAIAIATLRCIQREMQSAMKPLTELAGKDLCNHVRKISR